MPLLDIDHFKQVNDTFGHDGGDRVLVEVAHRLGQTVRPGDLRRPDLPDRPHRGRENAARLVQATHRARAAERLLTSMAQASYRHAVTLRTRGTPTQIRARLPAGIAQVRDGADEGWHMVEIRAGSLDWYPRCSPPSTCRSSFERPDELRDRVLARAGRLTASGRKLP